MKVFNLMMVALMVVSGIVMYITPDGQLFEGDPIEGKIAALVFIFSLLGLLGNLGVFSSKD